MSTRANVVIHYEDRKIGGPSELWFYHHLDGNVQGIGTEVVRAVHTCGQYITDDDGLGRLWDKFPLEFENMTGMSQDIEFLYRVTYVDNAVVVTVRHGGYIGKDAISHYDPANDTLDNSVKLYSAQFEKGLCWSAVRCTYNIREPESYIRTLSDEIQLAVRRWRGRLP